MYIALSYKYTLYTGVAYTSYLAGNLNIFIGKTLIFNSSVLFIYPFRNGKLYYNSGLFLNRNIDLTSISL